MVSSSRKKDTCDCKCYPNGVIALVLAQILLVVAIVMSSASIIDCQFVIADIEDSVPSSLVGLVPGERQGLGFLIHEETNGDCRWEYWGDRDDDENIENEIEDYVTDYVDWLGSSWKPGRGLGTTALVVGTVVTIWAFVFACVAHIKPFRYFMGVLVSLLLMSFQFSTLSVLNSSFCDERSCALGRSGGCSVAAGILFFLAGVLFFLTKDFPGRVEDDGAVKLAHAAGDEENVPGNDADTHIEEHQHDMETIDIEDHVQGPIVEGDGITDAQEVKPETAVLY